MADVEQTQIVTRARELDLVTGDRVHCLELAIGDEIEKRHIVTPLGLKIGRTAPAEIVIADAEISRSHCMIMPKDDELYVSDLGSTNGTFIDGNRVEGAMVLPVGSVLQVGNRTFKHEWRTRAEIEQSNDFDRELQIAASYVKALLPPPSHEGPVRAEWIYLPSAKLGGDAFGYGRLSDDLFVGYLIDVAGHGAGAAGSSGWSIASSASPVFRPGSTPRAIRRAASAGSRPWPITSACTPSIAPTSARLSSPR